MTSVREWTSAKTGRGVRKNDGELIQGVGSRQYLRFHLTDLVVPFFHIPRHTGWRCVVVLLALQTSFCILSGVIVTENIHSRLCLEGELLG